MQRFEHLVSLTSPSRSESDLRCQDFMSKVESYCVYDNCDGSHHVLAVDDDGGHIVDGCESMTLVEAVRKARELNGGRWPFIADEKLKE